MNVETGGGSANPRWSFSQKILVKPRPDEEMALLETCYKNTLNEPTPVAEGYKGELPNSGMNAVRLVSFPNKSYDPWLFIRVGNRKLSDPNNPQTLEGWRELEKSLIPSTMRDEVRLTRFRIEYLSSKSAPDGKLVKEEFSEWLESLPEPQRLIMALYPYKYEGPWTDFEFSKKFENLKQIQSQSNPQDSPSEEPAYVPTSGEVVVAYEDALDSGKVKRTVEVFPNEVYFGDTVYFPFYLENLSDSEIIRYRQASNGDMWMDGFKVVISSPQLKEEYRYRFENPTGVPVATRFRPLHKLVPGEKYCYKRLYLELCPLEAYDDPFWQELRENLSPDGVICEVNVETGESDEDALDFSSFQDPLCKFSQKILVKPRPDEEMALLENWYKNMPKDLTPVMDGRNGALPNSGKSNIRLPGYFKQTYDPWLFIRAGYRKPSDPNNPQTLEGWRDLEASLIPSTLRDEIRLTRFRIEYLATKRTAEAERVTDEYAKWMKSLPEPQRKIMLSYPYVSHTRLGETEFGEKYWDLQHLN
ncbi:MAG: hypothetical protein ACOX0A_09925 [Thermoguttaceae bacterium]